MAAPSVATTLTSTVPTIVPATLKSEATMAADTEASALAMTWIGLTVSRWSPSGVEGPGRLGIRGWLAHGLPVRRAESLGYRSWRRRRARQPASWPSGTADFGISAGPSGPVTYTGRIPLSLQVGIDRLPDRADPSTIS